MFFHYRTQGLILKKEDRSEADQIFTIYTKDFGKLEILAKAIRKIKSKLRGGVELFYLSEIEFIQGKTQKTLTDAILIDKFENLRKDLKRLAIAYQISEVFDGLIKGQEPDIKIWHLLKETFAKLNCSSIGNYQLLFYYFLWNLFSILGYQPELYNCSLCCEKLIPREIFYFNSKEGGIICPKCFKKFKEKSLAELNYCQKINSDIIKILRVILNRDWSLLTRLKITASHYKLLKDISRDFLRTIPFLK